MPIKMMVHVGNGYLTDCNDKMDAEKVFDAAVFNIAQIDSLPVAGQGLSMHCRDPIIS